MIISPNLQCDDMNGIVNSCRNNRTMKWDRTLLDKTQPHFQITPDGSIFFFLTSGGIDLTSSESCSVEAATRLHPGKSVFVLFTTPNITEVLDSNTLSVLLNFENVYLRYIQLST